MKPKPITPLIHGIIDYAFALAFLSVPSIIKIDKKARRYYKIDALTVITYSAFTKYPAGIRQIIPLQLHKKLDYASLALIAFETCNKTIKKDRRAISFSISMITSGLITVLLTDWKTQS